MHEAHDRAFVVAGAMKEALLEDIHQAMIEGLKGELPFDAWLERFDEIVASHGWRYRGGRDWRARVIYETNLRTARAAGRFRQMRHPDTLAAFPYWRYVHAFTRVPNEPREEHESWDGLILPATDPWWETYYPPNGWRCSCGVEPITEGEMRREKGTPDTAPQVSYRKVKDPLTGEQVNYPDGVDFGWAYAPGRTWALGLEPRLFTYGIHNFRRLQAGNRKLLVAADADELPALPRRPFPPDVVELDEGHSPEYYVERFLQKFDEDATADSVIRWRDRTGAELVLGKGLFIDAAGNWKLDKQLRKTLILYLAEALLDPDEIWLAAGEKKSGDVFIERRYVRSGDKNTVSIAWWNHRIWQGKTVFETGKRYLDRNVRWGVLLYRRDKGD